METGEPIDDLVLNLRKEYESIKHDKIKKAAWFELHSSLSNDLLSKITGYSITWLYKIKYGCKTHSNKKRIPRANIGKKIITINVPNDWDNREWLERQYKLLGGLRPIARAVGCTLDVIRNRFKRYGIKTNSGKDISQNPCRNKSWIYEHYITKDLNIKECAELAQVSIWTFKTWVMKYKIYKYPRMHAELLKRKAGPEIEQVIASKNILTVIYKGKIKERYSMKPNTKAKYVDNYDVGIIPKLSSLYELDFGVSESYLMKIDADINKLPFIGKRIIVHKLINDLVSKIPNRLFHSRPVLDKDLHNLIKHSDNIHNIYSKPVTVMHASYQSAGRWLTEHFFDVVGGHSEFRLDSMIRSRRRLLRMADNFIRTEIKFDGLSLIRAVFSSLEKFVPPLFYVNLFKKIGVTGRVFDPYPYFGSKALACAALGIEYYTPEDPFFETGMCRGFSEYVGLQHRYYNNDQVDWVISDYNLRANGIFLANKYKRFAKHLLVYVPNLEYKATIQVGKPHHKIDIGTHGKYASYGDDSFLVW